MMLGTGLALIFIIGFGASPLLSALYLALTKKPGY